MFFFAIIKTFEIVKKGSEEAIKWNFSNDDYGRTLLSTKDKNAAGKQLYMIVEGAKAETSSSDNTAITLKSRPNWSEAAWSFQGKEAWKSYIYLPTPGNSPFYKKSFKCYVNGNVQSIFKNIFTTSQMNGPSETADLQF